METIQIVLDQKLLHATDRAAQRAKQNRSALVREALRAHLKALDIRALEEKERWAYAEKPQDLDEAILWERAAASLAE
jgi:metal-responsive CopG/Arc/MetJ family transcriptional regulator